MADKTFPKGLIFKVPSDKAPDFVKGTISIKKGEFIDFLNTQEGDWVNIKLLTSREGKAYSELDTWKPGKRDTQTKPDNRETATESDNSNSDEPNSDLPF